jgi:dihydrodipicolinate reductase
MTPLVHSVARKLFGIRNNCLSSGRNLLLNLYKSVSKVVKLTVIIIEAHHCY